MQLNLGRIGPYLSDRYVISNQKNKKAEWLQLRKADTWWDWFFRIVSWICSPASYTEENRKAVRCFHDFLKCQLGEARTARICNRYGVDFNKVEKQGNPLLSRDIAKLCTGIQDVKIEDIEELIELSRKPTDKWPVYLSNDLRSILTAVGCSEDLSVENFKRVYEELRSASRSFSLPNVDRIEGGAPTELFAIFFFDPFLSDWERLSLQEENPEDSFEVFAHNFSTRIMRRELEVGMLIPAPNRQDGKKQFYRVAARLVTGEGNISYCLVPATKDTDLKSVQFYRGTSTRPGEIDSFSSLITDLEKNIGQTAWDSGEVYRPLLKTCLPPMEIVAGHSLGSTLAQHHLIKDPTVRVAYLFHGPGLSLEKIAAFNQRMEKKNSEPVHLVIRDASRDDLSMMGSIHIGFEAPSDKVSIDYRKYHAVKRVSRTNVHTTVWDKTPHLHGFGGYHTSEALNAELNHNKGGLASFLRETVGPCLAKVLRVVRDFFRWIFGSRALELQGLQLGTYQGRSFFKKPAWKVLHIRPWQVTQAMFEYKKN